MLVTACSALQRGGSIEGRGGGLPRGRDSLKSCAEVDELVGLVGGVVGEVWEGDWSEEEENVQEGESLEKGR